MPTSDWGEWLPRTIAQAEPDGVDIWYIGCNGFVLKAADGTTLFIDPYLGTGDPPRTIRMIPVPFDPADVREADAILATHEHTDHVHGPSQGPILERTDATFYGPSASVEATRAGDWQSTWSLEEEQFQTVSQEDHFEIGPFSIHVGPANDGDAEEPVSYVIDHPTGTLFHGGDTKPTDAFEAIGESWDIDLSIVAFGAVGNLLGYDDAGRSRTAWYCDENQVVDIANALQTDRLLPSHWDMWKGMNTDPKVLHHHVNSWPFPRQVEIVEIGDRIALTRG